MSAFTVYFAFGSNLHEPQMRARCPDCEVLGPATVAGYRLAFRGESKRWDAGGVATILPSPKGEVQGLLYRLSPGDLASLNGYEGYPHVYTHLPVDVQPHGGALQAALTYQRRNGKARAPSLRYFHQIWRGYKTYRLDERLLMAALEETLPEAPQG